MTLRALAGRAYRAAVTPFGRRALESMLRDGLPPQLATPLRSLFGGAIPEEARDVAPVIETRRAAFAASGARFRFVVDGDSRWPEAARDGELTSAWLANQVSVPARWGMLLHLLAADARTILELGACIGVSGAYLASAPSQPRLVSLEGSSSLAAIAEETFALVNANAAIVRGSFATTLPAALQSLPQIDLAFLDGHHEEQRTIDYVRALLPHIADNGLIVLDDISLWSGMRRAWRAVSALPGIRTAIDTGRFGLLLRQNGAVVAKRYDLARYTGWWPVAGDRQR